MKTFSSKRRIASILFVPLFLFTLASWGVFGHEHINKAAVLNLPDSMRTFYYNHVDFLIVESTVPDLRKYTLNDRLEGPKHYIDLENYNFQRDHALSLDSLKKLYDEKHLSKNGTLPWHIEFLMEKLTKAFKEKRRSEILFLSGELGHYIADAHMPLHTTVNHDGQLTGQKGVHALWESRLPEMFGQTYSYKIKPSEYYQDLHAAVWKLINHSHALVDTLLAAEKSIKIKQPDIKVFETDQGGEIRKNKFGAKIFTTEYAEKFHLYLNGMVEQQMKKAIHVLSSFWYTAWVNAGKPNLSELDAKVISDRNRKNLEKDFKDFKNGKLTGLNPDKEF